MPHAGHKLRFSFSVLLSRAPETIDAIIHSQLSCSEHISLIHKKKALIQIGRLFHQFTGKPA
jgi:hypothetical protein